MVSFKSNKAKCNTFMHFENVTEHRENRIDAVEIDVVCDKKIYYLKFMNIHFKPIA